MLRYGLKRLLLLIPVLWAVVTAVFFMMRLAPGDPVDWILGEGALALDRQHLREELGLHLPLLRQYFHFLGDFFRLDWGYSYFSRQPVMQLIAERLPATLELGFFALAFALLFSLPLGIISALRARTWVDRSAMVLTLLGISVPSFWLGPLLILLFSIHLFWLPASGRQEWASVILPALTLGTAMAAITARMVRASLLEILDKEFVTTARAKGVREFWVICGHALRNGLIPVVTIVGLQCGILFSGAIVTEKIFSWPGMGSLMLQAIERRDFAVVEISVLIFALGYVLINTATDILCTWIDPRLKQGFVRKSLFS